MNPRTGDAQASAAARNRPNDLVVLSPHLDDVVLSAYSILNSRATVVTVLAAVPPPGGVAPWDAEGGAIESRLRVEERRNEDQRALHRSGATIVHLDFADGQYATSGMLPRPTEEGIAAALEPLLRDATEVYVPAGIGNTDHALVRDAALRVRHDAILFADLPYALKSERGGFNLPRDLASSTRFAVDVSLEPTVLIEKVAAVREYATQLPQLVRYFGDFLIPAGLGRERFWRHGKPPKRNDLCWCGSGSKFKRCHGRTRMHLARLGAVARRKLTG